MCTYPRGIYIALCCCYFVPAQNKLLTLQESAEHGEQLKRDQEEAISKLGEVQLQLDLVKELQKQFTSLNSEVS